MEAGVYVHSRLLSLLYFHTPKCATLACNVRNITLQSA